jgi:hypoxanthine-guanine phosphoribosyltransferase
MPSCKNLRQELVDCVLISDCIIRDGKTLKECVNILKTAEGIVIISYSSKTNTRAHIAGASEEETGIPDKCRIILRAHQICVKGMVSVRWH